MHSTVTPLRDFYDTYYNAIDRLNQDYHAHFQLRNWPDGVQWGLHSALFYFLNSAHALWEEHRVVHTLAHSGRQGGAVQFPKRLSIPKFILEIAEALVAGN